MKILHLSDLHIGLKLHNRDLAEDQRYVFRQIIKMAKEQLPQAIVIAGDIYDRAVPSAEAVDFFDWFISSIRDADSMARKASQGSCRGKRRIAESAGSGT